MNSVPDGHKFCPNSSQVPNGGKHFPVERLICLPLQLLKCKDRYQISTQYNMPTASKEPNLSYFLCIIQTLQMLCIHASITSFPCYRQQAIWSGSDIQLVGPFAYSGPDPAILTHPSPPPPLRVIWMTHVRVGYQHRLSHNKEHLAFYWLKDIVHHFQFQSWSPAWCMIACKRYEGNAKRTAISNISVFKTLDQYSSDRHSSG